MGTARTISIITLAALLVLFLAGGVASAQSTGGSMGGGSFGGGSSYSSGSSYSYSSGSSYSYSSSRSYSSYDSGSSGSGPIDGAVLFIIVVGGLMILVGKVAGRTSVHEIFDDTPDLSNLDDYPDPAPSYMPAPRMDVTVLQLGIDWRARRFVQNELARIAKTCNTATKDGLTAMLRETTVVLRRVMPSWLYAGASNTPPVAARKAERMFREKAQQARSRYQHERIRNAQGTLTSGSEAPELIARSDEGEGIVVVTVVAAAREELIDIHDPDNAESMRRALEALGSLPDKSLVAVEIVWSPAEEDDRMSSSELEVLYPELHRIRGASIAGRVYCSYCSGPYPAELNACPHCGGRADAEDTGPARSA